MLFQLWSNHLFLLEALTSNAIYLSGGQIISHLEAFALIAFSEEITLSFYLETFTLFAIQIGYYTVFYVEALTRIATLSGDNVTFHLEDRTLIITFE